MMKNLFKGIMMGGAAIGAVTMLPIAGAVGTITMAGAAISGTAGFVVGSFMEDDKKDEMTEEYYLTCRSIIGRLNYSVTKEDEVYDMFNYVYNKIELMHKNTGAVLDREKFNNEELGVEFRYNGGENVKDSAKRYLHTLFAGYVETTNLEREKMIVLDANLEKIEEKL